MNNTSGMEISATQDYWKWRQFIFSVKAENAGLSSDQPDRVYGVLMDLGMMDTQHNARWAFSLTAFASGEASFRPTPGGGVMGLGGDKDVAQVAEKIVEIAQGVMDRTKPTQDLDLPMPGIVKFYLLTTTGIRVTEASLRDMQSDKTFAELLGKFASIRDFAESTKSKNL